MNTKSCSPQAVRNRQHGGPCQGSAADACPIPGFFAAGLVAVAVLFAVVPSAPGATQSGAEPDGTPDAAAVPGPIRSFTDKADYTAHSTADDTAKRLWEGRVSSPDPEDDVQAQIALAELIEKIQSVRFQPRESGSTPPSPTEPSGPRPQVPGASAPKYATSPFAGSVAASPAASASANVLPPEATGVLQHLLAEPNQVNDPLSLAELLFLSDHLAEAAVFYQKALDRATAALPAAREDHAWILLQLGNCLRETETARAQSMYARVVAEHADSPWVELAKAHSQLLAWYERIQPGQWIARAERQPAGSTATPNPPQP